MLPAFAQADLAGFYTHMVHAKRRVGTTDRDGCFIDRIGNKAGRLNGWCTSEEIYGRFVKVEH